MNIIHKKHRTCCLSTSSYDADGGAAAERVASSPYRITVPLALVYSQHHVDMELLESMTRDFVGRIARHETLKCAEMYDENDEGENEADDCEEELQMIHPHNGDAVLLKCHPQDSHTGTDGTQPSTASGMSIWGLPSTDSYAETKLGTLDIYQPEISFWNDETSLSQNRVVPHCMCLHPRGHWSRAHLAASNASSVPSSLHTVVEPSSSALHTAAYSQGLMSDPQHIRHTQPVENSASVSIIDLASLQLLRRTSYGSSIRSPLQDLRMNTPAAVLHLLRSSFSCEATSTYNDESFHGTSPWKHAYSHSKSRGDSSHLTTNTSIEYNESSLTTFCIVLLYSSVREPTDLQDIHPQDSSGPSIHESWDILEQDELKSFIQFRTGDAVPSYFLYSVSRLRTHSYKDGNTTRFFWNQFISHIQQSTIPYHDDMDDFIVLDPANMSMRHNHNENNKKHGTTQALDDNDALELAFLIYKPIPPRLHILPSKPDLYINKQSQREGQFDFCQWERIIHVSPSHPSSSLIHTHPNICEDIYSSSIHGANVIPSDISTMDISYRRIAPPYQDPMDLYPLAFQNILENLDKIRNEALSIPLWTAWPERNHYETSTRTKLSNAHKDDGGDETNIHRNTSSSSSSDGDGASWTVFPLCHTFPATNLSSRKWITNTCQHVPFTWSLLQNDPILSPLVRTALFSRLEPHTMLSPHTGWADLANYVLRVHIPLVVPSEGQGLCGLWVDGCVETHDVGRIICFDDSKVHRAFNYSDEERIVLIVDVIRPMEEMSFYDHGLNHPTFPLGTSVGGHTDELDAFIRQFE